MASNRSRIEQLIDEFEQRIAKAFRDAIDDLRSGADLKAIIAALERHDIRGAIDAMHLSPAAFDGLDRVLVDAYRSGGVATAAAFPPVVSAATGAQLFVRFDGRNVEAERWISNHSSTLITAIVDDKRSAIRTALEAGMQAGANPRQTALEIIGRVNPETGKRQGSIIGLTAQQERFVAAYQAELASTDASLLKNALARARRDKRFDGAVKSAIESGKPIEADKAAKMVQRYKDSLLKLRGETIGRTESLASIHAAKQEAFRQAVESGLVEDHNIIRTWSSTGDARVRDTHRAMDGQRIRGIHSRFVSPSGATLAFPCDPTAPPSETCNCRCVVNYRIDYTRALI